MLRRSTVIVLIVFVVLLGIAFYLQRNPLPETTETASTPTTAPDLFSWGEATINKLRIENQEGTVVELVKNGENEWDITSIGTANASQVSSAITQLSTAKVLSKLEPVPALSVIGLDPPANQITIYLDDGRVLDLDVGVETPTKSGYYVRVEGGEPVVIYRYSITSILDFLEEPPLSPTPVITETGVPLLSAETPFPPESPDSGTKSP